MSKSIQALSMLLVFTSAVVAQANCGDCDKGEKASEATAVATEQCTEGSCSMTAAMEKLPKISYTVGDESVCCEKSAAALAEENGTHMHFVVGDKEYDSKADAQLALVKATEEFVSKFAEPHTCKASGKVTLAGAEQHCQQSAGALAKKLKETMDNVQMTYVIGEEECHCPMTAAKLAKEEGVEKMFLVGKEKTSCEHTARLNLALAKYKAALAVIAEATADESKEVQGS
ncbi:MAG: hypothetical protein AAGD11_14045 [Planctomycetota bacterium]